MGLVVGHAVDPGRHRQRLGTRRSRSPAASGSPVRGLLRWNVPRLQPAARRAARHCVRAVAGFLPRCDLRRVQRADRRHRGRGGAGNGERLRRRAVPVRDPHRAADAENGVRRQRRDRWPDLLYFFISIVSIFNWEWLYSDEFRTIGIVVSLIAIVLAALSLTLDFGTIEAGVDAGAPKFMEWYCGYGLMVTLIWLYITILKLLALLSRATVERRLEGSDLASSVGEGVADAWRRLGELAATRRRPRCRSAEDAVAFDADAARDRHGGCAADDTEGQIRNVMRPPPVQAPQHRLHPDRHPRPQDHTARNAGAWYTHADRRARTLDDIGGGEERGQSDRSPHHAGGDHDRRPGQPRPQGAAGLAPPSAASRRRRAHWPRPSSEPPAGPTTALRAPCSRPTPVRCRGRALPRRWTVRRRRVDVSSRRSCGSAPTVASAVATTAASPWTSTTALIRITRGGSRLPDTRVAVDTSVRPFDADARSGRAVAHSDGRGGRCPVSLKATRRAPSML